MKLFFEYMATIMGGIFLIGFCFGGFPVIPVTLCGACVLVLQVYDFSESIQDLLEKRKKKAAKHSLIPL